MEDAQEDDMRGEGAAVVAAAASSDSAISPNDRLDSTSLSAMCRAPGARASARRAGARAALAGLEPAR